MPSSSSGMTLCSLESNEPLTVVPLVLPRSLTIQIPFSEPELAVLARDVLEVEPDVASGPPADDHLGLGQGNRVSAADRVHDPKNLGSGPHGISLRVTLMPARPGDSTSDLETEQTLFYQIAPRTLKARPAAAANFPVFPSGDWHARRAWDNFCAQVMVLAGKACGRPAERSRNGPKRRGIERCRHINRVESGTGASVLAAGCAVAGTARLWRGRVAPRLPARRRMTATYSPFKMGLQSYSLRGLTRDGKADLTKALAATKELGLHYWESYPAHVPMEPGSGRPRSRSRTRSRRPA